MNNSPSFNSNHFSGFRDRPFSEFRYFSSIIDRIQNKINTASANALTDKPGHSDIMIILADDDSDDRELFEEVIAEISPNINVKTVENCYQLLQVLREANTLLPDILFLDLNMPGMSGKQCLREIKEDIRLNKLPVIIYSTSSLINDIKDTYSIGANFYLQKPNSFNMAISLIKKVFAIDFENLKAHSSINNFVLSTDPN